MRAVVQERYGPPEQVLRVKQIERPVPGPGAVLVRVRASSVNTPDWAAVTGVPYVLRLQAGLRPPADAVRGSDLSGVVEEVGEGVTDLRPGDEVFGSVWDDGFTSAGAFAEYTVAPVERLVAKPPGIGFEEAAAAVMSGLTALCAVRDTAGVERGTKILVNGASGGVGTFAVQIAAHYGAEVTGVCGPRNVDMVRELGARHVVDYTRVDFTRAPERYDVILDNVLNHPPSRTARALAPGGVLIPNSLGNSGGVFAGLGRMARAKLLGLARRADVRFSPCVVDREHLRDLGGLLASGAVATVIDRAYPLEEAGAAVAHMLGHHARGNVAVAVAV
ncbi:NAD(P)-dependent alcohol dehydrogenase [Glycomyces sp. TRM65418]|uniref:NAD(P)-dependent alcohol dehydrogenase n=1 Tax=Glycomyces sp. TRM65418 TaxID=2867006 RepID=UPI001CE4D805|nr:NAD(P)-dependent alcohol dehydrogenase [Glycomyces sp. TRM65418]MCC3765327.1 NAD(P)-dependent alcohol dehydrogenase [Glycomyces sp. TRM65418]QZD54944.1 NAD(P)-dependent alcohol dehydrogenase [Glycomyces sp. TRM65418]